jgi:hypothetical protein
MCDLAVHKALLQNQKARRVSTHHGYTFKAWLRSNCIEDTQHKPSSGNMCHPRNKTKDRDGRYESEQTEDVTYQL